MGYLKPPWFTARVFNRIAMATGLAGCTTLAVRRRSGAEQQIPVIPVEQEGVTYLVSSRGESDWVKNVRAAPTVTLTNKGTTTHYVAAELPVDQRGPVLSVYREVAGRTVDAYFRKLPAAADHPVFVLRPA